MAMGDCRAAVNDYAGCSFAEMRELTCPTPMAITGSGTVWQASWTLHFGADNLPLFITQKALARDANFSHMRATLSHSHRVLRGKS
jgi:hypothetical protein